MPSYERSLRYLILLAMLVSFSHGAMSQQVPEEDPSWQKYQYLLRSSTLEWLYKQPFILTINFELYDLNGNAVEKGTAQEAWGPSPERHFHIDAPSLKEGQALIFETPPRNHNRERYLVHQVFGEIARPFNQTVKQKDFIMDQFQQTFDGDALGCFALVAPSARNGATPTYCTDSLNHLSVTTGSADLVVRRKDFRKYHFHEIPMEVVVSYNGKTAIVAHVTELDDVPSEADLSRSSATKAATTLVPESVLAVQMLKKPEPKYPKQAKKQHISGSVLLTAVITKEGTITSLEVIASPDPLLSQSALDAVSRWTYKPYLLNGKPTEVDTTIAVNYNTGR